MSDLSNFSMVSSIMASETITNVCENNSAAPEGFRTFVRSEQGNSPISRKRKLSTPGMDGFRKKLSAEGILEESVALITNAKQTGTNTHYESAWCKCCSWCSQRPINSFKASLAEIYIFFTHCFHEGYECNVTPGYRLAVSAYREPIDRFTVGEHPRVSRLLSRIFSNRPTQPKFNFVWDIKNVIDFLATMNVKNLV